MRSPEEAFLDQKSFNYRFINCDAITELRVLSYNKEGIFRENLFGESGAAFNVNYSKELEREKEALVHAHQIPMTSEERPIRIFWALHERFPDVRWVGQSIHVPSKGIWLKPLWDEGSLKGPEGDDLAFVKRLLRDRK